MDIELGFDFWAPWDEMITHGLWNDKEREELREVLGRAIARKEGEVMLGTYKIELESPAEGTTLFRVGFGEPAQNPQIVQDAKSILDNLPPETGGRLALINGPASLPVAVALAHGLCHRFSYLGVFDPKVGGYVVAVAHGDEHKIGDIIKV